MQFMSRARKPVLYKTCHQKKGYDRIAHPQNLIRSFSFSKITELENISRTNEATFTVFRTLNIAFDLPL